MVGRTASARNGGLPAPWPPSTRQVALAGLLVVALAVLAGGQTLGGSERAALTVGVVLAEAMALYVGYGALTRLAAPAVKAILASN